MKNKDIEDICFQYSFTNMSVGDLQRAKTIVKKYTQISNGLSVFRNAIFEHKKYLEDKIQDLQTELKALDKFCKESDFEKLFEVE